MEHTTHHQHNPPPSFIDGGGHNKQAGHHVADFWKRFIICSLISIPVLALSHMIQLWLGFKLNFAGDKYVLAAFATFIIFAYGGYPFPKGFIWRN